MNSKTKGTMSIDMILLIIIMVITLTAYIVYMQKITKTTTINEPNQLDILKQYNITSLNCTTYGIVRTTNETCMVCTTITATFQHNNSARWKNEENHSINIDDSVTINNCNSN